MFATQGTATWQSELYWPAVMVDGEVLAQDTIATRHPERRQEAFELADLFAKQARRRAERLFDELFDNDDSPQYEAAQRLLEGRYAWLEAELADPTETAAAPLERV